MRALTLEQLKEKYDRDQNSSVFEESTFKALGFANFDDCRRRCMYENVRAAAKVIESLLSRWVVSQRNKLNVADDAKTRDNMNDEQVIHTMNHCTNYFIKNVFNIQLYDTACPPRPAIEPPPPPYSDVQ
ncbi:BRO-A [Urbanus proteus nucleopolyhedrovirus]|uniref:BRO-A n=1 Tax=Urbanus proteus nucleopolyhedrovirus TaxID=1675866 RepID=A0A162GUP6_9ABAC|nr:BRO-A [Urbanus proteus nucleopolyhedrovirus]AKR17360.1 BRO-A [Urbanus proteus nucleopolyhedrovirus]